jgi:hypothetical protein
MLSWVRYAYANINADVNSEAWFIVGPITGPAVITRIDSFHSANQFSRFRFAFSIVTTPDPTAAGFNAGVKLQGDTVASSVANIADGFDIAAAGGSPFVMQWPCWIPVTTTPRWLSVWGIRSGGAGNLWMSIAVRAERLWPDGVVAPERSTAGARRVTSALEGLRATARGSASKSEPARSGPSG